MTTETKVGLIVGLAFILVFAMILSNRGSRSDLAPPVTDLLGVEGAFDSLSLQTAPGSPSPGPPRGAALAADRAQVQAPPPVRSPDLGKPLTDPAEGDGPGEGVQEPEHFPPPPLPDSGHDEPAVAAARPAVQPPRPAVREYLVKPGDSLSKIARQFYGSDRDGVVRALGEANRDRIKSLDGLAAGQTILVPGVQELVGGGPASQDRSPAAMAPKRGTGERVYAVRQGDTLSSIARNELGQVSRWREIRDLNRDRLPDPDKVLPGMKLRLPPPALASARGDRR